MSPRRAASAAARTGAGAGLEGWPAANDTMSPCVRWRSCAAESMSIAMKRGTAERRAGSMSSIPPAYARVGSVTDIVAAVADRDDAGHVLDGPVAAQRVAD